MHASEEVMSLEPRIRKIVTTTEQLLVEGGLEVAPPLLIAGAAAVIENHFAGRYVEDLEPLLDCYCPVLGPLLAERIVNQLGGAEVQSYGKAGIVGLDGELEHVAGILHNLRFGDPVRSAMEATSLLPSTEKRAGAGATIDVPLKHVHDHRVRSHHLTLEMRVGDAPRASEIVIAIAAAAGGRPHARLQAFGSEVGASASGT
jgi:amino acid synthesis protein